MVDGIIFYCDPTVLIVPNKKNKTSLVELTVAFATTDKEMEVRTLNAFSEVA